jgi:MFS transporter, PPP family, 3-phenylpropionic acid transporter
VLFRSVWALSAASEVPLMYLSGRLIKRFGSEMLISVSLSAILLRNLIYALMPNPAGVVLGQLLHSLCFGLFHPVSINFIVTRVPARARGLGMAIYAAVGTGLSTLMGNVFGGWVIEKAGFDALFWIFAIFPAVGLLGYAVLRKRLA